MKQLLMEFKSECKNVCQQMIAHLEACEGDPAHRSRCEQFGQLADRIMGAAKTIVVNDGDPSGRLHLISEFTQLCKLTGYKCAQLGENSQLYPVVIGVLLDATERLAEMVSQMDLETPQELDPVTRTLLDRLSWVSERFASDISGGVPMTAAKASDSQQIQSIIAKLKSNAAGLKK